ncbi:alcohol dehydrogenase 1 [Podospora aff. communis PSN243]|uniref:alcohol dehydrogenase n=1 Tax=Podospora aff. communis PSN243 TaxID=3040156 RepID=A0AAV9GV84_9PEZI|nr:alcohol dehydrogenase 1 [Podospora aff. communis PSN243]
MSQPRIPNEQWAQVIERDNEITFEKIPVPTPGPTEVLINIRYSGVCHTDLHALRNDWPLPRKTPLVGGHEGAGFVVAKGSNVGDTPAIGDAVGIKWLNSSCLECSFCIRGDESLCPKATLSGYTVDGTFQQYAVADAKHVARLPRDVDMASVAPVLCAGLTVYKGLKESGARPGEQVVIVGAGGGLGSIAIQYAKAMGLHVIAVDGGDEKGEACKRLGAANYVDFLKSGDVVEDVRKASGEERLGPHAVLLLAPNEKPFLQATQYVRAHGTVVLIAMPAGAKLSIPVFDTVVRMVTVKGSYVGSREDTAEAVDFFARGLIKAPVKVVGLSKLKDVFQEMGENKVVGRYVLDMGK